MDTAPQENPRTNDLPAGTPPSRPVGPSAPCSELSDPGDLFLPPGEGNDDTPTIISKAHPAADQIKAGPPRESLAGSLRGRHLAHFELIEPIGVGGMAAVIRARDTQLDRFVALKILPPEMAVEEENIRRFHQEARAAAKLDHENIARVFFCGSDQRLHFIAFEFVEGENLRTILDRRGRLPVAETVRYILQIATGLEHAASRGVVHRDIKPSNIIITPSGKAKLVDMGLARSLEPQKDPQLTQSGVTLGTFDYISPEQALEPRDADPRSDIYSLGCTFYHLLTGKAPVPEGTAAKKLHHHQHVPPVDPRQFNPDIPDEVAAIMSRMMAKDPRDRYQRPIFLVQHLMQIVQKVGATSDLPEGGLIVEAPLPTEPRRRPLLFVSLGALALAVLIFLTTLLSQPEGPAPAMNAGNRIKKIVPVPEVSPPPPKTVVVPESGTIVVQKEEDLARVLEDTSRTEVRALLKGRIEIKEKGLTYLGDGKRKLILYSKAKEEATLVFKLPPIAYEPTSLAGLVLEGGNIAIENVNFEIEANSTPSFALAALAVRGKTSLQLKQCQFFQQKVPQRPLLLDPDAVPVASLLLENPSGDAAFGPSVQVDQCYFTVEPEGEGKAGQVAIALNGPAHLAITDGTFKPHGSLFHLRGTSRDFDSTLRLDHCSAFVHHGPAFRIDDEARCVLSISRSIFSGPGKALPWPSDTPHLIHQTRARDPMVRFEGQQNCYHNIAALWDAPSEQYRLINDLDMFNTQALSAGGKGDRASSLLRDAGSIWVSASPLSEKTPERAFALRPDVAQVRTPEKFALGAARLPWGPLPQAPYLPRDTGPLLAENEKVVDPEDAGGAPNVFRTLKAALAAAKSGDTLLLKQPRDGRVIEVPTFRFDEPGTQFTFKAYPRHHPILSMANTSEEDAAFFRIQDGRLHFEDLDFLLEPDQEIFKSQSVVLVGGNVACTFKGCGVTMKPPAKLARRIPVSLVALLEPEKAMVMAKGPRTLAEVRVENSFIRGEGDLLHVHASRPFDLTIENSLLCLGGSAIQAFAATREAGAESSARVRFHQVTAFTREPLIALRGAASSKLYVPLKVEQARHCIFTALSDRPLVLVVSPEFTEEGLRTLFDWKGEVNGYCNFDGRNLLESYRLEDILGSAPSLRLEKMEWSSFTGESDSRFPRSLYNGPLALQTWLALPSQLRPSPELAAELMDLGAVLERDLLLRLADPRKEVPAGVVVP